MANSVTNTVNNPSDQNRRTDQNRPTDNRTDAERAADANKPGYDSRGNVINPAPKV